MLLYCSSTLSSNIMNSLEDKTDEQLIASMLTEIAKSTNELKCAQSDMDKINKRIGFTLVLLNELIKRDKD